MFGCLAHDELYSTVMKQTWKLKVYFQKIFEWLAGGCLHEEFLQRVRKFTEKSSARHKVGWHELSDAIVEKWSLSKQISLWIHVSVLNLNRHLCTEFLNEMNSPKKRSFCFQRLYVKSLSNKRCFSCPTEFMPNLQWNLHTLGKFCIQCQIKLFAVWKYLCRILSLFFPEIFFVKYCIEENTLFVAAVNFP